MQRRQRFGIVDFTEGDNTNDNEIVSYCKSCEKYGFKVRLLNRIYPDGQPIPVDHDQFLQCHECGLIVPIYELEKEPEIKNLIESVETPFDNDKNQFLGVDSRKARRKARKKEELFGDITDEVQRELAKGNTLISYIES